MEDLSPLVRCYACTYVGKLIMINVYIAGVVECPADTETNSIVPIAVGAALAGLVVIVLIAYLIGRRKRRSGYESV